MKHFWASTAASLRYSHWFETILGDFATVLNFKGNTQRVTKVRLQSDCEPKLVYNSSSLRLCRCAEFIFPFPSSVVALCLILLRWFLPLIYFSLVLPVSRD